jgi:hypothetical protein
MNEGYARKAIRLPEKEHRTLRQLAAALDTTIAKLAAHAVGLLAEQVARSQTRLPSIPTREVSTRPKKSRSTRPQEHGAGDQR